MAILMSATEAPPTQEALLASGAQSVWPREPYKRLDFLEARDAALFSQRDREVHEVAGLVEDASTRIVLLHGLSGVGKSSFLRAGLVPLLSMPDRDVPFFLLRKESGGGEPIFLRATDDPIGQLHAAVLDAAEGDRRIAEDLRASMRKELAVPDGPRDGLDRNVLAAGLTRAIAHMQRRLPGSLLLIVDQAEEVLTLGQSRDPQNRAAAFFAWLEEIVRERLDLRLIITLRTEYVGQFGARLSMQPTRTVTAAVNARAGLEDYLLNPLNDEDRLVDIILRPTRQEAVDAYPPPFETYHFTYEPGLAEQIARDCLNQARGTSALALVQVVCADLYDAARARVERRNGGAIVVTAADYRGRGVDVALDSYIDTGITHAVDLREPARISPDQLERWREVLSALVARDEGGAVRTQMLPRAALLDAAGQVRLGRDAVAVIDRMPGQRWRLLRRAPWQGDGDAGLSLGHDVIAGALARWKEAEKPRREAKRSRRRARLAIFAAFGVTILAIIGVGAWSVLSTKQTMRRLTEAAQLNNAELRLPLLLVAETMNKARDAPFFVNPFISAERENARRVMVDTLITSPVLGDTFAAVGYDRARRIVATLSREGRRQVIRVHPLGASRAPPMTVLDEAWVPPNDPPGQPPALGILAPSAGVPPLVVLYEDQVLRMWPLPVQPDGSTQSAAPADELPATVVTWRGAGSRAPVPGARELLLPPDFIENPPFPPMGEVDGGRLHFLHWVMVGGRLERLRILRTSARAPRDGQAAIEPVHSDNNRMAWETSGSYGGTRMPVIDEGCGGRYAFLGIPKGQPGTSATLNVYRGGFGTAQVIEAPLGDAGSYDPTAPSAWSVAHTPDCRYLVVRDGSASLRVIPVAEPDAPAGAGPLRRTLRRRITVPSQLAQVVPAGYSMAQPFLAAATASAADGAEMLRVAWLVPSGVAMIEAGFALGEQAELDPSRLLFADLPRGTGWGRLSFSEDGALLFVEARAGFADQAVQLRVFDLRNEERRHALQSRSDAELFALGCDTAATAGELGNQMTPVEQLAWLNERPIIQNGRSSARQPCPQAAR